MFVMMMLTSVTPGLSVALRSARPTRVSTLRAAALVESSVVVAGVTSTTLSIAVAVVSAVVVIVVMAVDRRVSGVL